MIALVRDVSPALAAWTRLDAVEALTMPPDFARALAANKKAKTFFEALSPALRASRIAHAVSQAAKGLRPAHQEKWRNPAMMRAR